jgi:hypothetical protein
MSNKKLTADQSRIVTPPSVVIAGGFAVSGFTVAVFSGLWAMRSASATLADAILALLVCYPIGYVIGRVATIAIDERVEAYCRAHPLPEVHPGNTAMNDATGADDLSEGAAPAEAQTPKGAE